MAKKFEVRSCVNGQIIPLQQVADPVFAQRLAGDGVAIKPKDVHFYAPVSGTLKMMFGTNHAFVVENAEGFYILVHIGTNTLALNGKGFNPHMKPGDLVTVGDLVISVDEEVFNNPTLDFTTIILVMNDNAVKMIEKSDRGVSVAAESTVLTVTF